MMEFEIGDIIQPIDGTSLYGLTFLVSSYDTGGYFLIPISEIPERLDYSSLKVGHSTYFSKRWTEYTMQSVS